MMNHQCSEPTTMSTDVYGSDGTVGMKQEPQNDSLQVDDCGLNVNLIKNEPIFATPTEICKIEDIRSIKQKPDYKLCEILETFQQPAVKCEN